MTDSMFQVFRVVVTTVLIAARPAAAQTPTTVVISGVVQDQTGAVLPHAAVELTSPKGVVVQATSTDDTGRFRFPAVPPGRYELAC